MASENPQDRAALDRLIRQLGGVQAELERQLGAAREEQAAAAADRKAAEDQRASVRRESTARRRQVGAGGRPTGRAAVTAPEEPQVLDRAAGSAKQLADNQERALGAARQRVREVRLEGNALARNLALIQQQRLEQLGLARSIGLASVVPERRTISAAEVASRQADLATLRQRTTRGSVSGEELLARRAANDEAAARGRAAAEARRSAAAEAQAAVAAAEEAATRTRAAAEAVRLAANPLPPIAQRTERPYASLGDAIRAGNTSFRGGGGGGGLPPAPPTGPGGTDDGERYSRVARQMGAAGRAARELSDEEQALLSRAQRVAQGELQVAGAVERATRAYGLASTGLRRHGALTTEFIEAAAKGQTTINELGYQVTATIGKFAGWTAAATAVYGALAAVSAMGRGALASESGVGLLSRSLNSATFDADGLRDAFSDLAHEFNLPIEQVVQGAYGMTKVFQDQNQALEATKAVLFAVKVGELDADTSTRALTATINGFGLSADSLVDVMDAVDNAQNKLGGNTGQLVLGMAKSAGAARNAGLDFRQLIAILATGSRLTGQTGEQVGTAVGRSISVLQTAAGQARARAAGLDPQQPYLDVLRQAQRLARGQSPERVQEIARALVPAGGQFARIFVPLIQNAQQLDKALGVTSAQDARGASARELAKALRQPNEQLGQLVTNLERVGAKLAEAGALDPFVGVVGALNKLLNVGVQLIDLVDKLQNLLPAPFNSALVPALELYGVLRLMRRFDVGGSLPAGGSAAYQAFRGSLARREQAAGRSQVLQGLGEERKFLEDQRQNTAKAAALSAYQTERARGRVVELQRINAGEDEVLRAQKQFESRLDESRRLAQDEADLRSRIVTNQQQTNRFQTLSRGGYQDFRTAARNAGINYYGPTNERPTVIGPVPLAGGQYRPGSLGSTRTAPIILGPATGDDVLAGTRYTAQGGAVTGQLAGARVAIRNRMEAFRAQNTALQIAAREGGVAARTGAVLLTASATGVGAAAKGIGAMGAGLRAFGAAALSALGPLDILLVGAATLFETINVVQKAIEENNQQIDRLQSDEGGFEGVRARSLQELRQRSLMDRLRGGFAHFANFWIPFGDPASDPNAQQDDYALKRLQEMQSLERAQGKGALKYLPQIKASLSRRLAGAQDVAEQEKAIDQAVTELQRGWAVTFGDKAARKKAAEFRSELEGQMADLRAAQGDVQAAVLRIRDLPGAAAFVAAQQQRAALEGYNRTQTPTAVGAGIARFRELIAEDPGNAGKYLEQIQALQGLMKQADERFQRQLSAAKGVQARGQVRRDYVDQYRTQIATEQNELARLYARTSTVTVTAAQARNNPRLATLRVNQIKDLNRQKQLAKQIGLDQEDLDAIQREQELAQAQEEISLYDARTQARVAAHSTKLAGLREQLRRDRDELAHIAEVYGKDSTEYVNAVAKARQDRDAVFDERISRLQSDADLRAAQETDPVAAAQDKLDAINQGLALLAQNYARNSDRIRDLLRQKADAQRALVDAQLQRFTGTVQLNRARSNIGAPQGDQLRGALSDAQAIAQRTGELKGFDSDEYRQALQAVYEAQGSLADYVRQQAQAMIDARADYRLSLTDDPVKQATIRLRQAQQKVQFAQTPAERLSALAEVHNAERDKRQAIFDQRVGNIDFDLEMERIDRQTAIDRYEALLQSTKLTKEQKRTLQQKIHALKKEADLDAGGFDLDVGSIKMPTVLDVRRAFASIGQVHRNAVASARGASTDLSSTVNDLSRADVNAQVNVYVTDANAADQVYGAIDRAIGTGLKAKLRNAGRR